MSAFNDLDKWFRDIYRNRDLLIKAYLSDEGFIENTTENGKVIDQLTKNGVLWLTDDDSNRARIVESLIILLNSGRRDEMRRSVSLDIAERLRTIEDLTTSYRVARKAGTQDEQQAIFRRLEEQVYSLRENLSEASRQIWQEVNSEFGYVTTIELKLQENQRVIDRVKRMNDNLGLIDYPTLSGANFAGESPELRRLFLRSLVNAASQIRAELVDAMHRLESMLFAFRKQQQKARLVRFFYQRFQNDPGFLPANYAEQTLIPAILNQVAPLDGYGHADLEKDAHETILTDLIGKLRKREIVIPEYDSEKRISTMDQASDVPEIIPLDPLQQALQDFFLSATPDQRITAQGLYNLAPDDCSEKIWIYAIIAKHNLMTDNEKQLFKLDYVEHTDPVFNGRHIVSDLVVSVRQLA